MDICRLSAINLLYAHVLDIYIHIDTRFVGGANLDTYVLTSGERKEVNEDLQEQRTDDLFDPKGKCTILDRWMFLLHLDA